MFRLVLCHISGDLTTTFSPIYRQNIEEVYYQIMFTIEQWGNDASERTLSIDTSNQLLTSRFT